MSYVVGKRRKNSSCYDLLIKKQLYNADVNLALRKLDMMTSFLKYFLKFLYHNHK